MTAAEASLGRAPRSGGSASLRSAVVRNATALMFSTVASSALGMLFWIIGVRLYQAEDVGRASAGASAITLLGGLAQLSLNSVFVRFLPTAGSRTGRVVRYAYGASGAAAIIVAVGFFLLGLGRSFLQPGPVALLVFCAAVVATAVSALQDSVLTALRRTAWVPVENIAIALGKLGLLPALAGAAVATPMLLAWGAPIVAAAVVVSLLIFFRLAPAHATATRHRQSLPGAGELASFMTAEYLKGMLGNLTLYLPPVLVTLVLGPEQNAFFYLPWLIGSAAFALSWNISISFVVEASADPGQTRAHLRHAIRLLTLITIGGGAVLAAGAPLVLAALGKAYAVSGTTSLRLIGLSLPFDLVMTLFTATAIMAKRTWVIFWAQLVTTVIFLSTGYLGLLRFGVVGMAGAYLVAHALVGVALTPATIRRLRALVRSTEVDQAPLDATVERVVARGAAPVRARGVAAVPHIQPGFTTGPVQVIFLPVAPDGDRGAIDETVLMERVTDQDSPPGTRQWRVPQPRTPVTSDDTTVILSRVPRGEPDRRRQHDDRAHPPRQRYPDDESPTERLP